MPFACNISPSVVVIPVPLYSCVGTGLGWGAHNTLGGIGHCWSTLHLSLPCAHVILS